MANITSTITHYTSSNTCNTIASTDALYIPTKKPVRSNPCCTNLVNPSSYQEISEKRRTDKRVYLNVRPLVNNPTLFADRVQYVLGHKNMALPTGNVYGFLYSCLGGTAGLVFPYTPKIDIGHNVNYEKTDIFHSNLSVNHYKNTPPPTYTITATFTANNKDMAKHMLSALWFLRAVTKCDFGEQATGGPDSESNGTAGVPPPVLYLNGWNNMLDNIPVIVKSFNYSLPDDKDYVSLPLNLDSMTQEYINNTYSDINTGTYYSNLSTSSYESLKNLADKGISYINGQPILNQAAKSENATNSINTGTNRKNAFFLQEWLPTELTITIQLEVQYNLLKYKKMFNLDKYKMGILYLDNQKSSSEVYMVTEQGTCERVSSIESPKLSPYINDETGEQWETADYIFGSYKSSLYQSNISTKGQGQADMEVNNWLYDTGRGHLYSVDGKMMRESGTKSIGYSDSSNETQISGTSYNFDNSGWTW